MSALVNRKSVGAVPAVECWSVMSHQAIRLGDSNDFIELRCLQVGKAPGMSDGDLRIGVSVRDNDCAASYEQVWIAKDDWEAS